MLKAYDRCNNHPRPGTQEDYMKKGGKKKDKDKKFHDEGWLRRTPMKIRRKIIAIP